MNGCQLSYNSAGQRTGSYAVAIQIEDFASSTDTVPLSSIPLQFLVKVNSVGSCGTEPVIVDATLPDGASSVVLCNVMFSFSVTAESLTSRLVLSH